MEETIDKLTFIGNTNQTKIKTFLKTKDPCFGKGFNKKSKKCSACKLPVLLDGNIYLFREVCKTLTFDEQTPVTIKNLSSNQVLTRIKQGQTPIDILKEIISDEPSYQEVKEVRDLVARRLSYLKNQKNLPVPSIDSVKEIWSSEF